MYNISISTRLLEKKKDNIYWQTQNYDIKIRINSILVILGISNKYEQ